jgi:transcriptional regulator GlxA family with amidase domain
MNRKLLEITNWSERARAAKWCVAELAKHCGVSVSILERHFWAATRECPQLWLVADRLNRAPALLALGFSVKEVSDQLLYKSQHHFSRAFKQHHGYAPSEHPKQIPQMPKPFSMALRLGAYLFCSLENAGLWIEPTYWCP